MPRLLVLRLPSINRDSKYSPALTFSSSATPAWLFLQLQKPVSITDDLPIPACLEPLGKSWALAVGRIDTIRKPQSMAPDSIRKNFFIVIWF
jgi:hypothetical protein